MRSSRVAGRRAIARQLNWKRASQFMSAAIVLALVATPSALGQTSSSGQTLGPALPPTTAKPAIAPTVKPATRTTARPKPRVTRRVVRTTTKPRSSSASSSSRSTSSGIGQGARGPQVLAIQQRLQELKYDISNPDGRFGNETWHAVLAFQKANNLSRTARVNTKMLELLEAGAEPAPVVPDGGADRIEVDLKRQVLTLYRDGALARIVSISSGTGKPYCELNPDTKKRECDVAKTPVGSFRVQSRIAGFRESKLGLLYNPLYFVGGFAIHGSNSVPGYPASHGCVRIPNKTSEWFVTDIPDKIAVYVFDGTTTPKPLAAGANPLPPAPGSATASPTAAPTTTTTTPGIARVLTTLPGQPTVASSVAPTTPVSTIAGSPTTVVVTPPLGGSTTTVATTTPTSTVPPTTVTPPTSLAPETTTTTQGTIPIQR